MTGNAVVSASFQPNFAGWIYHPKRKRVFTYLLFTWTVAKEHHKLMQRSEKWEMTEGCQRRCGALAASTRKAKHLHTFGSPAAQCRDWHGPKNVLQVACYLRGLLHLSNGPKIRGRCPDLCGKVKGVGAHSKSAVGRKFWNLHGNKGKTQSSTVIFPSISHRLSAQKCAQRPPKGDTWFVSNCPLHSCQTHWFTHIMIQIVHNFKSAITVEGR